MNKHSDEIRISIKNLLQALLRGWKPILLTALILAVLSGCFWGVTALQEAKDPELAAQRQAAYELELEAYESQVAQLEMEIEIQQQGIDSNQTYLAESLLMSIDPYNEYVGTMNLYISAETDTGSNTEAAVLLYQAALSSDQIVDKMAAELGTEGKYLREITSFDVTQNGENTAPVLTITVQCASREQAQRLLDLFEEELDTAYDIVAASIGAHTATAAVRSIRVTADQTLVDTQKNALNKEASLITALDEIMEELAALSAPSQPDISTGDIVKSALKYAVVFGVVGLVLAMIVICVKFIFGDRVYSGRELENRCGLRVLGGICVGGRNLRGLNRALWRMEERPLPGDQEALALLGAKLRCYAPEAGDILLTGQTHEETAAAVANMLDGFHLHVCGSLLTDPQAMELLHTCDCVVLLEQCGFARYSRVNLECDMLRDLGIEPVGCLAVDG